MIEERVITEKKKYSVGAVTVFSLAVVAFIIVGTYYLLKTMGEKELHTPVAGLESSGMEMVQVAILVAIAIILLSNP